MLTHFTATEQPGRYRGFNVTTCDRCRRPLEDVNAVTLHEQRERLLALGLAEVSAPLPEMLLDERTGEGVCADCLDGPDPEADRV